LAQVEAQIVSLTKIQQSLGHEAKLDAWLSARKLNSAVRLWQQVEISKGWEVAVESFLGSRLNALVNKVSGKLTPDERPPSALFIAEITSVKSTLPSIKPSRKAMREIVSDHEQGIAGILDEWLEGVYLLTDDEDPDIARQELNSREYLVNLKGDIYTRNSLSIYAAQSAMHGVLERQRELEDLNKRQPEYHAQIKSGLEAIANHEQVLQQTRDLQTELQLTLGKLTQDQHSINIDLQRLVQQRQHVVDRQSSIQSDLTQLKHRLTILIDEKTPVKIRFR